MDVKQKATFSILPILISIAAYVFTSSQIFVWIENDLSLTNFYTAAIALGSILMGYLSDSFCRRKMLIAIHVAAPILVTLCYFYSTSYLLVILAGLVYNPLSTVRANLVDNTREYSKIRLISLSFVIQFLPDTLYILFEEIPKQTSYVISLGVIGLSLAVGLIFFFDRRDNRIKYESMFSKLVLFVPDTSKRAILTFLAFIPTQVAYFIADNLLDTYSQNPFYYSILSFGSLLGAALSALFKRTPHVSVLTIAYGVAFLVSVLPLGAKYLYGYQNLDIPYMFIALGTLLGFYISFVYDVVLHSIEKHFRGVACGVLDFVYAGGSLVTLAIHQQLAQNVSLTLILIAVAFAIALSLQRASR